MKKFYEGSNSTKIIMGDGIEYSVYKNSCGWIVYSITENYVWGEVFYSKKLAVELLRAYHGENYNIKITDDSVYMVNMPTNILPAEYKISSVIDAVKEYIKFSKMGILG